eukprot:CAMPEP_0183473814 /NCGR_PEP_ID=MMETSP0370-20130417/162009_1 /TAXON_ID=268820 /ORGANISM="Peridinium aciculiferum, Strain PAER-2" /LENGTH=46 /DNA_ID= /DNA_START= /DNA_END= /DNA_ORIENTATION=
MTAKETTTIPPVIAGTSTTSSTRPQFCLGKPMFRHGGDHSNCTGSP